MKKNIILLFLSMFFVLGLHSQSRLASPGNPGVLAGRGQAEIVINATTAEKDVAVWVNGTIAAHLSPKSIEKIIVSNGMNLIEIADTTARNGQWNIGQKRQLKVESNSNRVTIGLTTRYGAIVGMVIQETSALGTGATLPTASAGTSAQPTRPATPPPQVSQGVGDIENAVYRAAWVLLENLPANSTVAILSISCDDPDLAEFVIEELAYIIVDTKKFKVVDRKSLDAVQKEAKFQLSGDVDDNSAVSIGKIIGANVVITGSVGGSGVTRRVRAKALNVQTSEILAMASERY